MHRRLCSTGSSRPRRRTGTRDLPKIDVPVLVIQGDQDRVLPIGVTGQRLSAFIGDMRLLVIEGGPHAIAWTHTDQVNAALLDFLQD